MIRFFAVCVLLVTAIFTSLAQTDSGLLLDLEECISIAVEKNLSVQRSELQRVAAKVDLDQSRAAYLPSINLGGSYGYNWGRSIDPTTNQFNNQRINFSGLNGNSSVVLFNWFRIVNTVQQNRIALESSILDVDKAKNDLTLNVATLYLNVLFSQELLSNAQVQQETGAQQLTRTQALVKAGSLPLTSELELLSQVATNEVNVINAENNLDLAILQLKQAMLMPAETQIEIVTPELEVENVAVTTETPSSIYQTSLEVLPEIRSAQLQVQSASAGLAAARSGYTPTLSLNGSFSTNYSDAFGRRFISDPNGTPLQQSTGLFTASGEEIFSTQPAGNFVNYPLPDQFQDNLSRSLSLNLSIPIFNNLRTKSTVQRQKIALRQAEINVLEQENQVRQAIESAYNDARSAAKVYFASERQVETLEETLRSVKNQYEYGAVNFTDFQVATNNLFSAKSDLLRSKYDYIFKKKILDFYQGTPITL